MEGVGYQSLARGSRQGIMTGIDPPSGAAHSRFAQRERRRYGQAVHLLPVGVPTGPLQSKFYQQLRAQGLAVGEALRITRQLFLERLLVLECDLS